MQRSWMAFACLLFSCAAQAVELTSTVTFTTDYRFHGISQTAGDAAVQGSLDAAFDNGLYVGVWGSNVDFGDDANLEIDWYGGYGGELTESLSWDATFFYYTYPGYKAADGDYAEIDLNLHWKGFKLGYTHTNDYFNTSENAQYVALDYSHALNEAVSLDLHAGHSFGDYWDELDIGAYSDFSAGISGSVAGIDLSLVYLFNDVDDGMAVNRGAFRNDDTLLLSVSRTF